MKLLITGAILAMTTGSALAADYAVRTSEGYEVRRYLMDTGRAYGDPGKEYAVITPAPPNRYIYVDGARGPARIEIDDRPPFPGPDYIPLVK
jgi:hypothetical protein